MKAAAAATPANEGRRAGWAALRDAGALACSNALPKFLSPPLPAASLHTAILPHSTSLYPDSTETETQWRFLPRRRSSTTRSRKVGKQRRKTPRHAG